MDLLLRILNICDFPIERFFSANIYDYEEDITKYAGGLDKGKF